MSSNQELLEKALSLKNKKEFQKAIDLLESLLEKNPDSKKVKKNLIDILFDYGIYLNDEWVLNFKKAAINFQRIVEIDPKNYRAWYNLGIAYFNLNKINEALKAYNKAIDIKPDYEHCYYNIGLIYEAKNNLKLALKYYNKSLSIKPNFPYARQAKKSIEEQLELLENEKSKPNLKDFEIKNLKNLFQVSKRVRISVIKNFLNVNESELYDILIKWCKKYDFEIDGDFLSVNKKKISEFLDFENL
ncbi:MAG: tetratricopeptide repeat protein [Promethearchaeota archaeon]